MMEMLEQIPGMRYSTKRKNIIRKKKLIVENCRNILDNHVYKNIL